MCDFQCACRHYSHSHRRLSFPLQEIERESHIQFILQKENNYELSDEKCCKHSITKLTICLHAINDYNLLLKWACVCARANSVSNCTDFLCLHLRMMVRFVLGRTWQTLKIWNRVMRTTSCLKEEADINAMKCNARKRWKNNLKPNSKNQTRKFIINPKCKLNNRRKFSRNDSFPSFHHKRHYKRGSRASIFVSFFLLHFTNQLCHNSDLYLTRKLQILTRVQQTQK